MKWREADFWACSWIGFTDAWNGHHRFVLGLDPDQQPVGATEARRLEQRLRQWQQTGIWEDHHV
ncbi:hypothetical protein [Lichenihabitans psoromatis]|uniref:hypothetical protein n=1 Tax=Lichenihabitans psoromatis TaxID=2528642 RepID=UPI001036007D|nr:hypothetical protein [Lichenihabitans psoromatis]